MTKSEQKKFGRKEGRKECIKKEKKVEGGNWENGIREKRQNTLNDIDRYWNSVLKDIFVVRSKIYT